MTAAEILALILELVQEGVAAAQTISTAQASGVDITTAQLQTMRDSYKAAHQKLDALITAGGGTPDPIPPDPVAA
jgi:outer membrane protein TolC